MADEADSKSVGGNLVWVRVPPPAVLLCKTAFDEKLDFSSKENVARNIRNRQFALRTVRCE